jgi:hypothetical protein
MIICAERHAAVREAGDSVCSTIGRYISVGMAATSAAAAANSIG